MEELGQSSDDWMDGIGFALTLVMDAALIIAATNDKKLNGRISELAQSRNIPVNVVDNTPLCSFIMPSIVDRGPVQIAVSTGGASPVLARILRSKLESTIPATYGELAKLVDNYRHEVKQSFPRVEERRIFCTFCEKEIPVPAGTEEGDMIECPNCAGIKLRVPRKGTEKSRHR